MLRWRRLGLVSAFSLVVAAAGGPAQQAVEPARVAAQAKVKDGLDLQTLLTRAPAAKSAAPDVHGAFRFICNPSHESYDDAIVYPGQPGKSHLHQYFGNTKANATSTYASLRASGESTCLNAGNRSAYWIPAMLNGRGKVVRPDWISIYYKRRAASDPMCDWSKTPKGQGAACVDLPRGLKFVFGYDMLDPKREPTGARTFQCNNGRKSASIIVAAKGCAAEGKLSAVINAPECWDGKNLDSADHRSHVAYPDYGGRGYRRCPSSHPYIIPTFTLNASYTIDADLDRSGSWDGTLRSWHLSSDAMDDMVHEPGTTFHADWFGAWDDELLRRWTDNCINKVLNCADGDLGDGTKMKQFAGFSWKAAPRLVDPPPR